MNPVWIRFLLPSALHLQGYRCVALLIWRIHEITFHWKTCFDLYTLHAWWARQKPLLAPLSSTRHKGNQDGHSSVPLLGTDVLFTAV